MPWGEASLAPRQARTTFSLQAENTSLVPIIPCTLTLVQVRAQDSNRADQGRLLVELQNQTAAALAELPGVSRNQRQQADISRFVISGYDSLLGNAVGTLGLSRGTPLSDHQVWGLREPLTPTEDGRAAVWLRCAGPHTSRPTGPLPTLFDRPETSSTPSRE